MADDHWDPYDRVTSLLRTAWDRVKELAREKLTPLVEDPDFVEPDEYDAWDIKRTREDMWKGRVDPENGWQRHEEAVKRRYEALLAFRGDPYETVQRDKTPVIDVTMRKQAFGPCYAVAREGYFAEVERRHAETAAPLEQHHD